MAKARAFTSRGSFFLGWAFLHTASVPPSRVSNQPMSYIIKATDPQGQVAWMGPLDSNDLREFCTSRDAADTFSTAEEARDAIGKIPAVLAAIGIVFSVEPK
jgi:hypothetical protein